MGGLGCLAFLITASVLFIVVASVPDPVALGLASVAAIVPATLYALLVLTLDRYEREPRRTILAAFGWGAVGAVFFSIIASLIFEAILVTAVAAETSTFLSIAFGAPLVEETFKGIAVLAILLWRRDELDNVLDGLVYGALIGLGFAMTENILYFGAEYRESGMTGLGTLFVARAVLDGFGHAAYTATTGAAIGYARAQYQQGAKRVLVPIAGWCLAVFQHALWNTGIFVIAALQGSDASVLSVVAIEAPLFILPAVVVLFVIARIAGQRELRILRDHLTEEVSRGTLTHTEHAMLADPLLRKRVVSTAAARGGRPLRRRQLRFLQVAAELAFRNYHLSRGEVLKPGQLAPDDAYRRELATLRTELAGATIAPGDISPA